MASPIITKAFDGKFDDMRTEIHVALGNRVSEALETKKAEIAHNYFAQANSKKVNESVEVDEEEIDEEEIEEGRKGTVTIGKILRRKESAARKSKIAVKAGIKKGSDSLKNEETVDEEQVDELNRGGILTRYANRTADVPERKTGHDLALKKKWGDKKFGLPEPKVKGVNRNEEIVDEEEVNERDEGKPGKNFAKIEKSAAKEYGSKAAGERVAGAIRAKLAKKHPSEYHE